MASQKKAVFHPDGERSQSGRRRPALARAICATCAVKWECAGFAFDNGEDFGIWGGMSETDRATLFLIQDERRITCGTHRRSLLGAYPFGGLHTRQVFGLTGAYP